MNDSPATPSQAPKGKVIHKDGGRLTMSTLYPTDARAGRGSKSGLKMNSFARTELVGSLTAQPDAVALITPVTIKVSIVEDDAKLRETLVRYFAGQSSFRCVKAYPNAEDALADLPKNLPDVVLMDINLPGMNGIECVSRLRLAVPGLKIIMLTVFEEGEQVFKALSAGAFGYLVKSSRPAKILEAIRDVYEGGSPMSGHIARKVVQTFQAQAAARDETDALTAREMEVLQGLSRGHPYKQIASDLGISLSTVRTYIQRIYEKLHVHSQTEAVMKYARKQGS
jgi:DNA-binding NarL/FixJ family response regulator